MNSLGQRITDATPASSDIMRRFSSASPVVQTRDEARKLLLEHQIMEYRIVPAARVGTYPINRFKEAITPSHAIELIDGICSEGYSEEAMDERYALKILAKGTQAHETYAYENEKFMQDAGGISSPYELGATELEDTFNRLGQNPLLHNLWCWWGRPKSFPPWFRQYQRGW